jgi:ribonuclease D
MSEENIESIESLLNKAQKLSQKKIIFRKYDIYEKDFELFASSPYLSIDSEGMGLNIHRDRLCLLQICNDEDIIFIHFPEPKYDSPWLCKLLEQPMLKIFHYARYDMLSIYKYLNVIW